MFPSLNFLLLAKQRATLWTSQLVGMVITGSMFTWSLIMQKSTKWTVCWHLMRQHFIGCFRKCAISVWQPVYFYQPTGGCFRNCLHIFFLLLPPAQTPKTFNPFCFLFRKISETLSYSFHQLLSFKHFHHFLNPILSPCINCYLSFHQASCD